MNEVAAGDLPGLIFTYVWAFDEPGDAAEVERFAAPFRARGGRVLYVELSATREERERRNVGEFRLAEKASKRDLARSRELLFGLDDKYQLESAGFFAGRPDYLHVDNTHLEAAAVAELVIRHFALTRAAPKPEA